VDGVDQTVVPEPAATAGALGNEGGAWFADERGMQRRLRVSWHGERRLFVLSIWQEDKCTATFRLPVGEVPRLVRALVDALGSAMADAGSGTGTGAHRRRRRNG
jgi:hypothetical protein